MCQMRNPASWTRNRISPRAQRLPTLEAVIFTLFRSTDGISIYGVEVPWQQSLRMHSFGIAVASRNWRKRNVNSASRALSPQDPQKPDER
jgi:hypothetical protein